MKKNTGAQNPRRLLAKLFAQFHRQVEAFERREGENSERDARSLAALAGTLEKLTGLKDAIMKKKQDRNAKGHDRSAFIRALCERLEKLAEAEEPKKTRASGGKLKRSAG